MKEVVIVSWVAAGIVAACIYINKAYEAWKKKRSKEQEHDKDHQDPQRKNEKA